LNWEKNASVKINMRYKLMIQSPQFVVARKVPTDNELAGLVLAPVPVTRMWMKIPNLHLPARRKSKNAYLISRINTFTVY
jgi:hypothetical protein